MKKRVIFIAAICAIVIAGVTLVLTGTIKVTGNDKEKEQPQANAICWIEYMDTYVQLDKNVNVLKTGSKEPENLMKISGIEVSKLLLGEKLQAFDQDALDYGGAIAAKLQAVGISDTGEIMLSASGEAYLYIKKIKIKLGDEEGLTEKLETLRKFYNEVITLEGTLDMQQVDKNNMGYTFLKGEVSIEDDRLALAGIPTGPENDKQEAAQSASEVETAAATEETTAESGGEDTDDEYSEDEYSDDYNDDYSDYAEDGYADEYYDEYSDYEEGGYTDDYSGYEEDGYADDYYEDDDRGYSEDY